MAAGSCRRCLASRSANVFPLVIGSGLALCGLAIAFGIGHSFEEEERSFRSRAAEARAARQALRPARLLPPALPVHVAVADRLGFIITAALIVYGTATALGASGSFRCARRAGADRHLIFSKLLRVPLPIGLLPMPW
jgi:putative tricarboxylic transport membrane protein